MTDPWASVTITAMLCVTFLVALFTLALRK